MLFSLLPTAIVIVGAWAGAAGPHAPGDGMQEYRRAPKPPLRQEAAAPQQRPVRAEEVVRISSRDRR